MTSDQYKSALTTLGLSQLAAGRWLGVSKATAQRYATTGPSEMAAKLIRYALRYGLMTDAQLEPMTEQEVVRDDWGFETDSNKWDMERLR